MSVADEVPLGTALLTRALLEASPDAVVIVDARGAIVALNVVAQQLLGYAADELVGRSVDLLVPEAVRAGHAGLRAGYGGKRRSMSARPDLLAARRDGSTFSVQVSLTPVGADGNTIAAVLRDVTELRRLTEESERWAHVFQQLELGVVVVDGRDAIELLNPAYGQMHGRPPGTLVGRPFAESFADEEAAEVPYRLRMVDELGHLQWEATHVRADGTRFPVQVDATSVREEGRSGYRALIVKDITAGRANEERLAHLATHDELTGLANRALLLTETARALQDADRGRHVAVLFCDLDQFKVVNDSIGHAAGDAMLVELSDRLTAALPDAAVAARPGGDEFVFLLRDLPGERRDAEEEARLVASRLLVAVAEPFQLQGRSLHTTMSIGIALSNGDGSSPADLLRDADAAMYRAKASGRGGVDLFDHELRTRTVRRIEVETELRAAAEEHLLVHFQPIVDLQTEAIVGAEALLRWNHPTRGVLPPAAFLDVAEDAGLIADIGRHVLETSARHLTAWQGEGHPIEYVTVNIAAGQLGLGRLRTEVASLLRAYGLPAAALRLEVTENTLLATDGLASHELAMLIADGLQVGLDDFGTGYGSLTHLMGSGATFLKLDRQFVETIAASPIAEAVIGLGRALGYDVIAEGIETEAQASALRAMGCRYGQGFLFSPAVEAGAFAALMGRRLEPDATGSAGQRPGHLRGGGG